jgi:predicted enzyme related to lactoylglutathione lyase
MTEGIKRVIYPVSDLARAKMQFGTLTGIEPYVDEPYYVGFRVGEQEIGLDPSGHKQGMTAYWHVEDIKGSLQALLDGGAQVQRDIRDVGGGRLIACVKDADGNLIGLLQSS